MLKATNLTKIYDGVTALDALNLTVEPGEVFCLLGANGAGKTTTINLFLNFIPPSSGAASINGLDVVHQPLETKKYLAYIPETSCSTGTSPGSRTLSISPRWPDALITRASSCWHSSRRSASRPMPRTGA